MALNEVSIADIFARAVLYPLEQLAKPIQDEGLKPHKEIIADVFRTLKEVQNGDALRIALSVQSRRLLAYWYGQAAEWVLRFPQRQHLPEDDQWIEVGNERILVTVKDIDGPVDIRELKIRRETPTEKDEMVIALNRESGVLELEEVMHPVALKSQVSKEPDGYPYIVCQVTFLQGKIAKLDLTELIEDPENILPSFKRTTTLDFSSVVRWGLGRDQ